MNCLNIFYFSILTHIMHVYGFAIYLLFFSLIQKASTEREEDKGLHHLLKRKTQNLQQRPLFVRDNEEQSAPGESDSSDARSSNIRYRRKDDHGMFRFRDRNYYERRPYRQTIESELDLKRNQLSSRKDALQKRDVFEGSSLKMKSPYGIVYGNGRPVGILEPYPQTYELSSLENANAEGNLQPRTRSQVVDILYPLSNQPQQFDEDGERDESDIFETAKYNDEKYPSVLTNFKIDTKMNNKMKDEQPSKRTVSINSDINNYLESKNVLDKSDLFKRAAVKTSKLVTNKKLNDITQDKIDELKIQLDRLQNPSAADNLLEIEQNLKNVLEDMGLIDEKNTKESNVDVDNQDVKISETGEDENLEEGVNRIELTKDNHESETNDRNKRENSENSSDKTKEAKMPDSQLSEDSNMKSKDKDDTSPLRITDDAHLATNSEDQSELKENSHLKKRESKVNVANYQVEGDEFIRKKRQGKNKKSTETQNAENADIMKGLENNNKSPLTSKSDDENKGKGTASSTCPPNSVAVNSDDIDYEKRIERDLQAKIDAIKEQVKREINSMKSAESTGKAADKVTQRKKRETVNTLLDEETSNLDPGLNTDETLKPLVRRRRNNKGLKRRKREIDVSDTENDDSNDYFNLNTQENKEGTNLDESNEHQKSPDTSDRQMRNAESKIADSEGDSEDLSDDLTKKSIETSRNIANAAPKENEATTQNAIKKDISETTDSSLKKRVAKNTAENKNKAENEDLEESKVQKRGSKTQKKVIDSSAEKVNNEQKRESSGITSAVDGKLQDRRRRQVERNNHQGNILYCTSRRKRANAVIPEANAAYLKFRDGDEEMDNEGDEFDDDGFDDRTANFVRKRQIAYIPQIYTDHKESLDYPNVNDENVDSQQDQAFEEQDNEKYGADLNPNFYERPNSNYANYLYADVPGRFIRRKRQNIEQLAAIHGGGPMTSHSSALRERSQYNFDRQRKKRKLGRTVQEKKQDNSLQLSELSDTDLFGGLPQSYEGELSRFKRVKRTSPNVKTT